MMKSSTATFWFIALLVGAGMTAMFTGGMHAVMTPEQWEHSLHGMTVPEKTVVTFVVAVVIATGLIRIQQLLAPTSAAGAIRQMRWIIVSSIIGFTIGLSDSPSPPTRWQDALALSALLVGTMLLAVATVFWLSAKLDRRDERQQ